MEQMRVVRLNARKFPPTEFETARLAHHGIQTEPFEPAHEEVSVERGRFYHHASLDFCLHRESL